MSSESSVFTQTGIEEGFQPYRALHKAAVFSVILAVLSFAALLFPTALVLPLVGFILGVLALRTTLRYPAEFIGFPLAVIGTLVCGVLFAGATAYHVYDYLTELPPGYERVSFFALKARSGKPDQPTAVAIEMNGKRVFIKGYMYPDGQSSRIKRFVLVPDLGTCCFGGQPKLTHMIEVTLDGPPGIDYSMRKRKLAGTLRVDQQLKPVDGLNGVYYQLVADYAR